MVKSRNQYNVSSSEYSTLIGAKIKQMTALTNFAYTMGNEGNNVSFVVDTEDGQQVIDISNVKAATTFLAGEIRDLEKYHLEATKQKKVSRSTTNKKETMTGTYSPIYINDVLSTFCNEGDFGPANPLNPDDDTKLVDTLSVFNSDYMLANSLSIAMLIYVRHNDLYQNGKKIIIAADEHMMNTFGNSSYVPRKFSYFKYKTSDGYEERFVKDEALQLHKNVKVCQTSLNSRTKTVSDANARIERTKLALDKAESEESTSEKTLATRNTMYNNALEKLKIATKELKDAQTKLDDATKLADAALKKTGRDTADVTTESVKISVSEAVKLGYLEKGKVSTFDMIKSNYPMFDTSGFKTCFLQNMRSNNFTSVDDLVVPRTTSKSSPREIEYANSVKEVLDTIKDVKIREQMRADLAQLEETNAQYHDMKFLNGTNTPRDVPESILGKELYGNEDE